MGQRRDFEIEIDNIGIFLFDSLNYLLFFSFVFRLCWDNCYTANSQHSHPMAPINY